MELDSQRGERDGLVLGEVEVQGDEQTNFIVSGGQFAVSGDITNHLSEVDFLSLSAVQVLFDVQGIQSQLVQVVRSSVQLHLDVLNDAVSELVAISPLSSVVVGESSNGRRLDLQGQVQLAHISHILVLQLRADLGSEVD